MTRTRGIRGTDGTRGIARPAGRGPLRGALIALAVAAMPAVAPAQTPNPWRPQGQSTVQYPPIASLPSPGPATGSYAPANLDEQLSGMTQPTPLRVAPAPGQTDRRSEDLTAPRPEVPPVSGAVAPPYAGLPLAGGYGYGYAPVPPVQPNTTIIVPYQGYPGAYGYPGYGYGAPGYGGSGMPGWGNGWNNGNNGWNGWNPGGFGSPMGGFSPFGFW